MRSRHPYEELIIDPMLKEIEALIEAFGNAGHSGASAGYAIPAIADTIKKALNFEMLSPLTGEASEWNDVSEYGPAERTSFQNNRLSSVFKDGKDGKPYYLNALAWKELSAEACWSGTARLPDGRTLRSSATLKDISNFPTKPFYIDVRNVCTKEGCGDFEIIDPSQLIAAEEFYELNYTEETKDA